MLFLKLPINKKMKILDINIKGFGKLVDKNMSFSDGINVIYGKNEAGKSTTHTFIKSMLFGMSKKKPRSKLDMQSKYEPWNNKDEYEGSLRFSYNGKNYTIYRTFTNKINSLEILDEMENKKLLNPDLFLDKVLSNLNETSFDNTISIGQFKSATESVMISELKKYIANLNTSGDMSINTLSALTFLKQQKNDFENKMIKNATVAYNKQLGNIKNLERELSNDTYNNQLPKINDEKSKNIEKLKSNNQVIDRLTHQIESNTTFLRQNGFEDKITIDTLKLETERLFMDYTMMKKNANKKSILIIKDSLILIISLFIATFNTIVLVISYPQIATFLRIANMAEALPAITNFILTININPAPLIGILYCISIMLFAIGLFNLISDFKNSETIEDMTETLSEIFAHQIGTPVVNDENMNNFKLHIKRMYDLINVINNDKETIKQIKEQNKELFDKQDEYLEEMKAEQRKQFEIDQRINTLNIQKANADKLKKDVEYNDEIQKEIDGITLAMDMLNELASKVKIMFGTYLNKKASEYIDGLTHGAYNSLNVDDSLNININTEERVIPLEQVSGGAMDQIYLAIRLATAELIQGNNEILPLIFDDCFAMYDNERLSYALKFLSENYKGQIIVFTCHTREAEVLKLSKLKFNYIEIKTE